MKVITCTNRHEAAALQSRCWAEIDLHALQHNIRAIRKLIDPKTKIMGIVKANGYGHGMLAIAKTLVDEKVTDFGVANIDEAAELRRAGFRHNIHLLSACLRPELEASVLLKLIPTVSSAHEAVTLNRVAHRLEKPAWIHFKIDTGMGRLGCWWENAVKDLKTIEKLSHVKIHSLMTHFASADDDPTYTRQQWKRFDVIRKQFPHYQIQAANSAGMLAKKIYQGDIVRPGLSMYGVAPFPKLQSLFKPVMSWKSRVTLIQKVPAGRYISYGSTYRLPRPQTLATVAAGYADGYPRALSNCGNILVRGVRCPIRGRVTMDQIMIDVSKVPHIHPGEPVLLFGNMGKHELPATELATLSNTIPYEIFCGVSERVIRIYVES